MKNSKKILLILKSLAITSLISFVISWAMVLMFSLHFYGCFLLAMILQIVGSIFWNQYLERMIDVKTIRQAVDEYSKKPFKTYAVSLACQGCGKTDTVELDLTNTEYVCSHCNRKNAIYVTITTAIMSV